jgi:hypothetical protein
MSTAELRHEFWLVVWLLTSLTTSGCTLLSGSQYSGYPLERELQQSDFPSTWYRMGGVIEDVEGAEYSHRIAFGPSEKRWYLGISQTITVYPDEISAREAFTEWKAQWFPTEDWIPPADFDYMPMDSEDRYHLACHGVTINSEPILSCGYLQQHNDYISLVLANMDGKEVTLEIFLAILERQDIRLHG